MNNRFDVAQLEKILLNANASEFASDPARIDAAKALEKQGIHAIAVYGAYYHLRSALEIVYSIICKKEVRFLPTGAVLKKIYSAQQEQGYKDKKSQFPNMLRLDRVKGLDSYYCQTRWQHHM